jgi:hypothetical protein
MGVSDALNFALNSVSEGIEALAGDNESRNQPIAGGPNESLSISSSSRSLAVNASFLIWIDTDITSGTCLCFSVEQAFDVEYASEAIFQDPVTRMVLRRTWWNR